jgi:hypothetical protein
MLHKTLLKVKETPMQRFLQRYQDQIIGVLSGFDRILFRGSLRSISYLGGLNTFLEVKGILLKDFARFASQCTEQIVEHAHNFAHDAGRPYIYLQSSSVRKDDCARQIAERDNIRKGLVCVLYAVEPCMSFDIYRNRDKKRLDLVSRRRKCRFFYFYFIDREFGLMHIRLQSWISFQLQVCINGRSYLAKQMDREGIAYRRCGNCFVHIDNVPRAQALLDRLNRRNWQNTLSRLAGRVNPLLDGPLKDVFGYYWSIRQSEVATDVMFKDSAALKEIYPALWGHALAHFSSRDVMRFLTGHRGGRFATEVATDMKRPRDGVRIKHRVNENSVKMYDKAGSVLRIETTINNPRRFRVLRQVVRKGKPVLAWQKMRKGVSDTRRRADISLAANARYLEALGVVGEETPSHRLLDPVTKPVRTGGHRYRGLRPIRPDEARLFEAVMHGEHLLHGLTNRDIRQHLFGPTGHDRQEAKRRSAHVSRNLRLLRAHRLIRKVPGRHLYRITEKGHRVMTTSLLFRQTDVALLERSAA